MTTKQQSGSDARNPSADVVVTAKCGVVAAACLALAVAAGYVVCQAQVATETYGGEQCANTTTQCSPGNGNYATECGASNPYGHCAYDFQEAGHDQTCEGWYINYDCVQTWSYCATWYAGTCSDIEIPDSGDLFYCDENTIETPFHSQTLATQCVSGD